MIRHRSTKIFNHFNSIKVRLEPAGIIAGAGSLLFQFHKGTIRTDCYGVENPYTIISIP